MLQGVLRGGAFTNAHALIHTHTHAHRHLVGARNAPLVIVVMYVCVTVCIYDHNGCTDVCMHFCMYACM